jgi:hypothetical protein
MYLFVYLFICLFVCARHVRKMQGQAGSLNSEQLAVDGDVNGLAGHPASFGKFRQLA